MENEVNPIEKLSKEELITYEELFSFFDKEDAGFMPIKDVELFIRGLGHCPTETELKQIKKKLTPLDEETVSFSKLSALLATRNREQNIEDDIIEAFQGYQTETGAHSDSSKNSFVSIIGLKKYLCEFGEAFSEVQAEGFVEFLKSNDLKVNDQEFDFRNLAKIMAYSYTEI